MLDDTIAPILYRTGRGDRLIPFLMGCLSTLAAPALAWLSGPYFWPWGAIMASAAILGGLGAFRRWRIAVRSVVWDRGFLEFRTGSQRKRVSWDALTRVEVCPSSVRTRLWAGSERFHLSHRLVRAETLLEHLRLSRPDLFPPMGDSVTFRRSSTSAVLQALLAAGTGTAGWVLSGWQPGIGAFFGAAAVYVLVRILFFIPRSFEVSPGAVTTRYWLRMRRWGQPLGVREEGYAAGGAVFFRMVLDYGPWSVVFDEGQLLDPLRPWATGVIHLLRPPLVG